MTLIYFVSRSNYRHFHLRGMRFFFFVVKKLSIPHMSDRSQRQLSHSFEGFPVQKDTLLKTRAK